jgi:C4-dicarboxylate-specific signal transduction histidine kinase
VGCLRDALLQIPAAQRMGRMLEDVAHDFGLPAALLIDSHGNIVANGPAGLQPPGIAANLRDREYFVEAMQRGQSSQFLFGRLTRTPGLYFAQRVDGGGQAGRRGRDQAGRRHAEPPCSPTPASGSSS